MVTLGRKDTAVADDDWTVVTNDGRSAAHFEHTFALTADGAWVLHRPSTAAKAKLSDSGSPYGGG